MMAFCTLPVADLLTSIMRCTTEVAIHRNHLRTSEMVEQKAGGCVCGALRYLVTTDPMRVTICHCKWCQRRTGSAFGVEAVFDKGSVTITGQSIQFHRHVSDLSGHWVEQSFCSRCGSNIGLTLEAVPGIRTIAAGTFDDPSWIDRKLHHFR